MLLIAEHISAKSCRRVVSDSLLLPRAKGPLYTSLGRIGVPGVRFCTLGQRSPRSTCGTESRA